MFHVELPGRRQTLQDGISRVQGGDEELCRQAKDLRKQALEVRSVELCSRIIHKQGRNAGAVPGIMFQLSEEHRSSEQFLLPS